MQYILHTPLTKAALAPLKAGDTVLLSGVVYTARDAAHARMMELLDKGEPLPLLSQVAERCRRHGMMANIEIKPTTGLGPQTGKVVALAARDLWQGMTAPLLSSFEIDALEAAQEAAPELPRGLLLDEWRDDWRELTTRLGCVSIHLNHKLLDAARVASLKQAGLHILVYTVNKPQRAAELLCWGVDCICTDAIDVIGPNFQP